MIRGGPQHIPRPPGVRAGDLAPWASLPPPSRRGLRLDQVRDRLAALGSPRKPEVVVQGARAAAVLVALFEENGETRVILTRRTTTLPSHRGEVSFPGGKAHDGERLSSAALREAEEEIGLRPADLELVAELDHLATIASRFVLAPFVGVLERRPVLRPNPAEVDRVMDVAIAELLDEGVFREERWDVWEQDRPVFFFELEGDTVWGATARILYQLCSLVGGSTGPAPPGL